MNNLPAKESVPDGIISELRSRIMRGEIKAGERLPPERELAKQLGTNRTSLREALRALEVQGLVHARQGDGVRVLDFRAHGEFILLPHYFAAAEPLEKLEIITNLMEIRRILVPVIVPLAVKHGTEEQFATLKKIEQELVAAHEKGDTRATAEVELQLYRAIVEASRSLTYLWVFNSIDRVARALFSAQPQMWLIMPDYIALWGKIVAAIVDRDADDALTHFMCLLDAIHERVDGLLTMLTNSTAK